MPKPPPAATMPSPSPAASPDQSFEMEAIAVASRLRADVAALLAALPTPVSGGTDLDRHLKLGSTVSWRLHSFATASNPVAALEFLPGRATIEKLAQAARRKGLPEPLPERVLGAYEQFEAFMQQHAGDRATLASLVGGIARDSATGLTSRRRAAFRDNSDLWGVQARTWMGCFIFNAGQPAGAEDGILIRGYVDARSLRRGATLQLKQRILLTQETGAHKSGQGTPTAASDIGLISEFCTQPMPKMTTSIDRSGQSRTTRFHVAGIGKSSAVTFFTSTHVRNINQGIPQKEWGAGSLLTLPVEAAVNDLLIPRGWANPTTVRTATFGNLASMEDAYLQSEDDRLPDNESAAYLGTDLAVLESSDVPRYPDVVRHVLRKHGWEAAEFDIFRCRVQFPILHTAIYLRVDAANR